MHRSNTLNLSLLVTAFWIFLAQPVYGSTVSYSWRSSPIELKLSVGMERKISIEEAESVSVGVPPELNHILKVQVIGNQFWIEATDAFDSTRMVVLAQPGGRIILNTSATFDSFTSESISVILDGSSEAGDVEQRKLPDYGFVSLTRWVAQQLYSPERLLKPLQGVVQIPVSSDPVDIFRCGSNKPSLCANAVSATPLASWQSPKHYVTAIAIANQLEEPVVLDPRELKGIWRTAAFLHASLGPTGLPEDNTVLILISDLPFSESRHSYF